MKGGIFQDADNTIQHSASTDAQHKHSNRSLPVSSDLERISIKVFYVNSSANAVFRPELEEKLVHQIV